jgi:hypothetical protein
MGRRGNGEGRSLATRRARSILPATWWVRPSARSARRSILMPASRYESLLIRYNP